jgi:hypothetical protein
MAKESGLGQALYVHGRDLSGETKQWDTGGGPTPIDVTGLRSSAPERIGGLLSGTLKYVTHFDPLAASHLYPSTLPTTDVILTMAHRETLGAPALSMVTKQIGYDPQRTDNAALSFTVDAQSNSDGGEWGVLGTAGKRTDTTATNGTGVDHGLVPPLSVGLQAYLHIFAFTGTNVTVKLQGSSDDAAGDPYADITGGSFGAQTAIGAWRLSTSRSQAVERWFRVVTTGTFTSVTFAVAVVINDSAVAL